MTGILLTQSTTPIIGQVAWLLGKLMDGIFNVLSSAFGIENIGLCIILFTIIIYTFMIPLTIKQQKFSKLSAVMNPELQAIQKKYKNKRDQESMLKMQEEMKNFTDGWMSSVSDPVSDLTCIVEGYSEHSGICRRSKGYVYASCQ